MGDTMTGWRIKPVLVEGLTCEEKAWRVIEDIWMAPGSVDDESRLAQLTPGQRAVYSLTWTEREVCNGGFHQYFWNPTGGLAHTAIDGSRFLGLDEYGDLIVRGDETGLGTTEPLYEGARQERLDRLPAAAEEELDGLADELYDLLETDPLHEGFCRQIDAQPDQFFLDEPVSPEERASALLDLARNLIEATPPRDFTRTEEVLWRAEADAIASSADLILGQIRSLPSSCQGFAGS